MREEKPVGHVGDLPARTSRCTTGASFAMRGHKTIRSETTEGCWFTPRFMQHKQLLSITFPRAEPRFTVHCPGQSLRPHSSGFSFSPLPEYLPWLGRQLLTPLLQDD